MNSFYIFLVGVYIPPQANKPSLPPSPTQLTDGVGREYRPATCDSTTVKKQQSVVDCNVQCVNSLRTVTRPLYTLNIELNVRNSELRVNTELYVKNIELSVEDLYCENYLLLWVWQLNDFVFGYKLIVLRLTWNLYKICFAVIKTQSGTCGHRRQGRQSLTCHLEK